MQRLFTPWRYEYLVSDKSADGCVFCKALESGDDREALIVHRGRHLFIILNRYPYNNGHVMVVPYRHLSRLSESTVEELHELSELASRCESTLTRTYGAEGINAGINLGRSAGAGIAEHYHLHVVPRWSGDTNFMAVTGETRLIPEELDVTWTRLREALGRDDG